MISAISDAVVNGSKMRSDKDVVVRRRQCGKIRVGLCNESIDQNTHRSRRAGGDDSGIKRSSNCVKGLTGVEKAPMFWAFGLTASMVAETTKSVTFWPGAQSPVPWSPRGRRCAGFVGSDAPGLPLHEGRPLTLGGGDDA